jgi:poly-beta-1,6-N-acetyl-D-glucosamine synthase
MIETTPDTRAATTARVLLISPVRNEAAHIADVVAGVAAQERPPDTWLVVDDGSTDGTAERLEALLSELPFARLVRTPPLYTQDSGDRNAAGGPDRAWNFGLEHVDLREYSHVGKLDGDIVLPPDYLSGLIERFRAEPQLGMAAGSVTELREGEWWTMPTPADHVTAPARLYSRECFEAIGGMPPYMGADMITTIYAKMRGFATRTFTELPVRHLRPMGTADGLRRGRERQGAYQYVVHYSLAWILLRSFAVAIRFRPYGISGAWFLLGYLKAAANRMPRVEDPEWKAFARAEQRRKIRRVAGRLLRVR